MESTQVGQTKKKITCFPSLQPAVTIRSPPTKTTTTHTDIAAILAAVLPHTVTTPPKVSVENDTEVKYKMAAMELEKTLGMCGQASTATVRDLPGWFQECMMKHTSDQDRQTIIRK